MPLPARSPLRGHRDFNMFWFGQAVSSVGSQVTLLAMPLTAVLYLHADAGQVGLLTAAGLAAFCGPSLLFGVLVDRVRRRTLMIGADIGRSVVIGLIPVLAWLHALHMPVLYGTELVQGGLTVIFEVTYRAYLPDLVGTEALLPGNSRLQATESLAQVGGPGLSGALVGLLGAPFTLLVDAGSFIVSWASLLAVRTREPAPRREHQAGTPAGVRGVLAEMRFGLRFIYRHPVLRALAGATGVFNLFSQLQLTLYVLYATRELRMSPEEIGLVLACFGVGGALSAATAGRMFSRLGYGPSVVAAFAVAALAIMAIPLVPGPAAASTAVFIAVYFVAGYAIVGMNIAMATMRQVASPASLQGRVNATFRFATAALMPVSALAAGALGERFGLRPTLFICAAGMPISAVWIALSPTRKVRAVQELAPHEAAPDGQAAAGLGHRQA